MEFETEEQQVEALKKWWKENGKQVVVGAVIGFGLIIGWRYYLDYSEKQAAQASALFEQVIQSEGSENVDKSAVYEKLKANYSSTPYSSAAALVVAKSFYLDGEKEKAISVLNEVIANSKLDVVGQVAIERKVRVLIDLGKADDALTALNVEVLPGFEAIFAELTGDAHVLKGDFYKARLSYDKALLLNQSASKRLLQMKRDNLGNEAADSAA